MLLVVLGTAPPTSVLVELVVLVGVDLVVVEDKLVNADVVVFGTAPPTCVLVDLVVVLGIEPPTCALDVVVIGDNPVASNVSWPLSMSWFASMLQVVVELGVVSGTEPPTCVLDVVVIGGKPVDIVGA